VEVCAKKIVEEQVTCDAVGRLPSKNEAASKRKFACGCRRLTAMVALDGPNSYQMITPLSQCIGDQEFKFA
jgi:hypothetical protein